MTNFVISTVASTINSKRNSILNTLSSSPFYDYFDEDNTWKKDKISSRLSDLTVQKSGYNEIIPTVYGTVRIAGNIFGPQILKRLKMNILQHIQLEKIVQHLKQLLNIITMRMLLLVSVMVK